jgi:hypothetical protein
MRTRTNETYTGETEMRIERQLITPALAGELLKNNKKNRHYSKHHLQRYAKDMKDGKWMSDTSETIKISKNGNIVDGQHRLRAIIESNVIIPMHIAFDVDESIMDFIDTGKPRTATDVFSIYQIPHAKRLPSIISYYQSYKQGYSGLNMGAGRISSTNSRLLEMYYENELYWQDVAQKTGNWYKKFATILPPSIIGGLYCYFKDTSEEDAEIFFDQLCSGYHISNNTIADLRNILIRDKTSLRKISNEHKIAIIIKTWNAFRKGTHLKVLKYNASIEKLPKPI